MDTEEGIRTDGKKIIDLCREVEISNLIGWYNQAISMCKGGDGYRREKCVMDSESSREKVLRTLAELSIEASEKMGVVFNRAKLEENAPLPRNPPRFYLRLFSCPYEHLCNAEEDGSF